MLFFNKILLSISCLLLSTSSIAQLHHLIEIDTTNGSFIKLNNYPNIQYVSTGNTIYDNLNGRYIFVAEDINFNSKLYVVDGLTGNVLYNPSFPNLIDINDNIGSLKWSDSLGTLYGLHWDNSEQMEYLISVNITNGNYTKIDSIPNVWYVADVNTTFDQKNKRLIFEGTGLVSNSKLYTIDVQNGSIISSPSFPNYIGLYDYITEMQVDTNGNIYALFKDDSKQKIYFVSINSQTGNHSIIDSLLNLQSASPFQKTFDYSTNQYIFKGIDNNNNERLYFINASNGNLTKSFNYPSTSDTNDNISSLQFDHINQKLLGLHWDNIVTGIKSHPTKDYKQWAVYPNPATDWLKIDSHHSYSEFKLLFYDTQGILVLEKDVKGSNTAKINTKYLKTGVYYLILESEEEFQVEKIVVN